MTALLLAVLTLAAQDPRVEATLSSRAVRVGDAVVYQIVVESGDAAPTHVGTPEMPGAFEVLRSQDFTETQLSFPGGRSRRFRREIVLLAHLPGTHTIPSVQVEVGGRHYQTPALQIVVTGAATLREEPAGRPRLRVEFVPDTVYAGQQALLRAEALIPEGRRPRRGRAPTFEMPQPGGFWTQELPGARQAGLRLIGPDVFEVHSFARAYFPLTGGVHALEPATVLYEVRLDWLSGTRVERMTSDSLRLTVLPLPTAGQPPGFSGAVGKFTIRASLDAEQVNVGEAATLEVEVRGEGNVKGLPAPVLPPLPGFDVLAAGDESQTWVSDDVLHGSRRFRWMLVAEAPAAAVDIEPIEYAFFDPFENRYRVVRSERLGIEVGGTATPPATTTQRAPDLTTVLRRESVPDRLRWVRSRAFAGAAVLPLVALLAALALRRRRPVPRREAARTVARAWHVRSKSTALTGDGLRAAFLRSIADALGVAPARLSHDDALATELTAHGVSTETTDAAVAMVHRIDAVRYAAGAWDDDIRTELVAACGSVLERVLAESARSDAVAKAAVYAGVVALLLAAPGSAWASEDHFAAGVAAYDAGDLQRAITHFAARTAAAPYDAAALANLGTAYHAVGDRPLAIAAWLRAVRVQPRDRQVRGWLEAVGAGTALRHVTPPARLSADEARLLAGVLWLVLLAGLALALLANRRRAGTRIAVIGGTLLLAHAAAALLHERAMQVTAVALNEPTVLRSGPTLRADDRASVPAGSVLRIVERRDNWLRVTHGTREGWVERRDAAQP